MEWRFVFVPSSWFSILHLQCVPHVIHTQRKADCKWSAKKERKRKEFNALRNQKRMSDEN
jgi:hypothetical protein